MFQNSPRHRATVCRLSRCFALVLCATAGCSDPPQNAAGNTDDTGTDQPPLFDIGTSDGTAVGDGAADAAAPGQVWLTFEVDDTENKTFEDGDIKWTGSFSWDAKTNEIVHASSWLPTDGPYPPLYDDGPISAGGHEHEGGKAGDHIFSTAVKFKSAQATTFEYGALNEFDNWMWIGPNGQLVVAAGESGTKQAPGMKLPKHGTVDLELRLDTSKLDAVFGKWSLKTHKFYVKGTMNMWTPVQLLDDGQKGDAAAGDDILTFRLSQNLGKHDGLANPGDKVQFVFVTTTGDLFPEEGQEYKGSTATKVAGVSGFTATGPGGAFVPAPVIFAKDSKGKFDNTAIDVPGGAVKSCEPACKASEDCVEGVCKAKALPCSPPCGEGQVCSEGSCKDAPCSPACDSGDVCVKGKCQPVPCEPACGAGFECKLGACVEKLCAPACSDKQVCKGGVCQDKTCVPACGAGQACVVDVCVDLLALSLVEPKTGPMAGGTKVTLTGKAFASPAIVRVGSAEASDVQVVSATQITAVTPPGKTGPAKVEVEVAGAKAEIVGAFTYDAAPKPTTLLIEPAAFSVQEGKEINGLKAIAKVPTLSQKSGPTEGLAVEFGVGPKGTLPNATPADPKDAWTWKAAAFLSEDTIKGEETYGVDLGVLPIGAYAFSVRATYASFTAYGDLNGSEDGVDGAKLGSILVQKPDLTPKVTGFEPAWLSIKGGKLTILGANLAKATKVEVVSTIPGFTTIGTDPVVVPGKGIQVTIPPDIKGFLPPRPANVQVTPPGAPTVTLDAPLAVVPIDTPTMDGSVGLDWNFGTAIGQCTNGTSWDSNSLGTLNVAYDSDNLYVGVSGQVEVQNAIVGYVDLDYGAALGVKNPADLKDETGALDAALSSKFTCSDAKFGAEFAFGSVGMLSVTSGKASDAGSAGWRSLGNINDFAWYGAPLYAQANKALETAIPLADLFPSGIPAAGRRVGLFVVITNKAGDAAPDGGAIPDKTQGAFVIDAIAWFDIFPPPSK